MDLIIIHENGWACTNKSSTGDRLSEVSENVYKRYYTVHAENVFNCIGKVSKGQEAFFLMKDGVASNGWICDVQLVNGSTVKAQKKSELTKDKIEVLINKIKK